MGWHIAFRVLAADNAPYFPHPARSIWTLWKTYSIKWRVWLWSWGRRRMGGWRSGSKIQRQRRQAQGYELLAHEGRSIASGRGSTASVRRG